MAINDKLNRIKEIKEDIKQALIDKGVEVTDEDSFGSYADKITNIPMEGGDPYYEDFYNMRTSNGTNMSGLFARATGDSLDLTGLDVSQCTNMDYMFSYANIKNIDISGWDTSKLNSMKEIFGNLECTSITGFTGLNLSGVTTLDRLFYSTKIDEINLYGLDINNITKFDYLFGFCNAKKIDLSGWNTSNVTYMNNTFYYLTNLTDLIIPDWDMTNVTSSSSFLSNVSKLKYIDLSRSNDLTISKITSFLPTKTLATYGEIHIPADSSQEVIDGLIAKYWRPVGPNIIPTSFEIASELDEVLLNGKTKIHIGNMTPWYTSANNVEFISSDESIATVNEDGEVTPVSTGNVEIYARLKDNHDVVSNNINIAISESDSYPNVIKFRGTSTPASSNYVKINGKSVNLTAMSYNSINNIYTYDAKAPITSIQFNGQGGSTYSNTLTELIKLNITSITDMQNMFRNTDITSLDAASNWDTSNVNAFGSLFYECSKLETLDLSKWDTRKSSNITGLGNMFRNVPPTCQIYIDKRIWKSTMTESATGFNGTFIDITPEWHTEYYTEYTVDTSMVTFSLTDTIRDGAYLPELSNGYTHIELTLNDGSTTTDLNTEALLVSSIRIYYPEETSYIKFANTKVKDVTHLNGTNITDCTGMFTNCVYLESADLSTLDSSKVTVDETMFEGVSVDCNVAVNDDWDIKEKEMGWIGYFNPYFIEYTLYTTEGSTDTVNINKTKYLPKIMVGYKEYDYSNSITITLKDGTTTSDTSVLAVDVDRIVIEFPENTGTIQFTDLSGIYIKEITYIKVDNLTNMSRMFSGCRYLENINGIENWNTSKITDMESMFYDCQSLVSLDLSNWNTGKVTSMEGMFSWCRSLKNIIGINDLNVSNVNNMESMFSYCKSIISMDLSGWDVRNVTNMESMFYGLGYLQTLNLTNWDTSSVTDTGNMFELTPYSENPICTITVSADTWTLTEEETYFRGTFNRI